MDYILCSFLLSTVFAVFSGFLSIIAKKDGFENPSHVFKKLAIGFFILMTIILITLVVIVYLI